MPAAAVVDDRRHAPAAIFVALAWEKKKQQRYNYSKRNATAVRRMKRENSQGIADRRQSLNTRRTTSIIRNKTAHQKKKLTYSLRAQTESQCHRKTNRTDSVAKWNMCQHKSSVALS